AGAADPVRAPSALKVSGRAASAPRTNHGAPPEVTRSAAASRTSRDLPTPAGPQTIAPLTAPPSARIRPNAASSPPRPTNGHCPANTQFAAAPTADVAGGFIPAQRTAQRA